MRVAFVASHPIQYQAPIFRHLACRADIDFQVMFAMMPDAAAQGSGFGVEFEWDIPLLEGYRYTVLDNVSRHPSVTQFRGCDTPSIKTALREQRIDAVVVNGWVVKTCLQTLFACKRLGIPCIVRGEANHLRPRAWWKRILQRQLVRRFDAYLPIGTANRSFYRSYGIAETQMFDARYCVENERFAMAADHVESQRRTIRQRWNVPEGATCFLYCGKFETKKHPRELVQAFIAAQQAIPNVHLIMVGDGALRSECERLVSEYWKSPALTSSQSTRRLTPPVTFTGFLNQSEIVNAYVASDCLVLPSDHGETWGLVVNESFACGRPAMVSDQVGCAADLVIPGKTGDQFPFGDWGSLTRLFVRYAQDRDKLIVMGQAAKTLIQNFSPAAAADGIANAVEWVTHKPS